jgi:hypothetical protein
MPIQKRHGVRAFGAVTAASQSIAIDLEEFTHGLLFLAGNGAVVTLQASPDGGTTWANVHDEAGAVWTRTVASTTAEAHIIAALGRKIRLSVITQNLTAAWVEGLKDI